MGGARAQRIIEKQRLLTMGYEQNVSVVVCQDTMQGLQHLLTGRLPCATSLTSLTTSAMAYLRGRP